MLAGAEPCSRSTGETFSWLDDIVYVFVGGLDERQVLRVEGSNVCCAIRET